nr:hypothetical protein BaRGS_020850 [Batillaria attramentaria]
MMMMMMMMMTSTTTMTTTMMMMMMKKTTTTVMVVTAATTTMMMMMMMFQHGHRELGHAEETDDFASRFSASVEVSVVVDAEFDGQYDCVASDSAGREVVYPMILERPTKIHAFFNETLENGVRPVGQ